MPFANLFYKLFVNLLVKERMLFYFFIEVRNRKREERREKSQKLRQE